MQNCSLRQGTGAQLRQHPGSTGKPHNRVSLSNCDQTSVRLSRYRWECLEMMYPRAPFGSLQSCNGCPYSGPRGSLPELSAVGPEKRSATQAYPVLMANNTSRRIALLRIFPDMVMISCSIIGCRLANESRRPLTPLSCSISY